MVPESVECTRLPVGLRCVLGDCPSLTVYVTFTFKTRDLSSYLSKLSNCDVFVKEKILSRSMWRHIEVWLLTTQAPEKQ